ncbi:hypothetical protein FB45DRAFT_1020613 [Roridomyces roridus]|uniref:Uncharacterized protein n=1 Tax=Roridomyces roridus TaxID=1738132 RepID=A0AAD7CAA6_9AGAR|nr:hypothetical protein FB45DRAFT_1020613 [Roridomyces roridus]
MSTPPRRSGLRERKPRPASTVGSSSPTKKKRTSTGGDFKNKRSKVEVDDEELYPSDPRFEKIDRLLGPNARNLIKQAVLYEFCGVRSRAYTFADVSPEVLDTFVHQPDPGLRYEISLGERPSIDALEGASKTPAERLSDDDYFKKKLDELQGSPHVRNVARYLSKCPTERLGAVASRFAAERVNHGEEHDKLVFSPPDIRQGVYSEIWKAIQGETRLECGSSSQQWLNGRGITVSKHRPGCRRTLSEVRALVPLILQLKHLETNSKKDSFVNVLTDGEQWRFIHIRRTRANREQFDDMPFTCTMSLPLEVRFPKHGMPVLKLLVAAMLGDVDEFPLLARMFQAELRAIPKG